MANFTPAPAFQIANTRRRLKNLPPKRKKRKILAIAINATPAKSSEGAPKKAALSGAVPIGQNAITPLGKTRRKTRLKKLMNRPKEKTENSIKLFLVMAKDIRIVLTKLTDRCHNVCASNALETLEIYAPIADRLGMGELQCQLEDLAFKYLHPEEYQRLENEVAERYKTCGQYIKKLEPILCEILKKINITPLEINARAKHLYSLYKKLLRHQMNFDKIYDLVAARIIVKDINDCYLALGAIHQVWRPMPGLIKDYIAMPKPNGYQSLHTSVFGPEEKITEIQIRTPEMHAQAENGVSAHWAYKERNYKNKNRYPKIDAEEIAWI